MHPATRTFLLSATAFLLLTPACQQQPQKAAPVPGIEPTPAEGIIGRRRQQPLPPQKAEMAVIFVGGFTEQVLLHFRKAYENMPLLPCTGKQLRAYYAWDSGTGNLLFHSTWKLQRDLTAFCKLNPRADIVLIGHSYGGSAIMDALRHLKEPHGRILVATIDPVSRRKKSQPRQRPAGVDYWVNTYCYPYRNIRDGFARAGGPWRHCEQADVNLNFPGTRRDADGDRYAHVYPEPMLTEPHPDTGKSVFDLLSARLTPAL
ncbi:MAG: alpha/beta hydrolase [Akkermansia sp.]|nr:alpha/beta hydrolase [Akkermansia sp.]